MVGEEFYLLGGLGGLSTLRMRAAWSGTRRPPTAGRPWTTCHRHGGGSPAPPWVYVPHSDPEQREQNSDNLKTATDFWAIAKNVVGSK